MIATTLHISQLPNHPDTTSAPVIEKAPHMSIATHDQTPAHGPNLKPRLLDALRVAWHRSRSDLGSASRWFTASLVLLATVACDGTGGTVAAAPATSACPGSVSLAWSITSASGQPLTCAQAGATSVALRLQNRTGGTPVFTAFPCANSPGTANVTPGLYDVAIELHDASGARLATSSPQTSVAVAVGRTKVLTPVTFAVGTGGGGNSRVVLTLETENVASNCQPSSSGGAGITGTTITIVRDGGGCAPATLVRSRGGTQIGTYKVNCSSPEVAGCIERDETLTTTGLAPAGYVVRVGGKIGAVDCWIGEAHLDVPATGQLQTKIALRRQSAPGC
jgi:hypothetical protein